MEKFNFSLLVLSLSRPIFLFLRYNFLRKKGKNIILVQALSYHGNENDSLPPLPLKFLNGNDNSKKSLPFEPRTVTIILVTVMQIRYRRYRKIVFVTVKSLP